MSDIAAIKLDLPALYHSADLLSSTSQRHFLCALRSEYALLIVCAAMSVNQVTFSAYYYLYTILFCLALALFLWRFITKPEQAWYQGRALAESVKTSSWRFCMKSPPFDDINDANDVNDFRSHLKAILDANQYAGMRLPAEFAAENQVTASMLAIRSLPLEKRMAFYGEARIKDQRQWYANKAGSNKRISFRWVAFCVIIYILAIISSLVRASNPDMTWIPTEVLIAMASSIVGWMQIKKFNELAASYILTAHEIGFVNGRLQHINGEKEFSVFVNESEQAFSREHTQWVARSQ